MGVLYSDGSRGLRLSTTFLRKDLRLGCSLLYEEVDEVVELEETEERAEVCCLVEDIVVGGVVILALC